MLSIFNYSFQCFIVVRPKIIEFKEKQIGIILIVLYNFHFI